ncbi:hypothetical protein Glove_302g55 [Diversispora epigaea]|uniref:Uncharacterized protein n=1 Tax=Diversispora epigaea TaxID=1348612 RepID=A0A397HW25_9GLOM|nr:hypothetical protein Glove_302g55 [Diversispora epigaea]
MAPKKSNKDPESQQLEKPIKSRPPPSRLAKSDIDCIMYAKELKGGSKKVSEWYKISTQKCNKIWKSEDRTHMLTQSVNLTCLNGILKIQKLERQKHCPIQRLSVN